MTVRVRIAPSPTGDPHVGTAYIALLNYAFARANDGAFVLRIEDTDRGRYCADSEQAIMASLRWLGLDYDEGPDVGGAQGPYRQSERVAAGIYQQQVQQLLEQGDAYRCFCSTERLAQVREQQAGAKQPIMYDRHCRELDPAAAQARADAGEAHVIRMKAPREGSFSRYDRLRGKDIVMPWNEVDDQVLIKGDGWPTYHLASVVDDHLMGISHVIRAEEWLKSLPKHVWLYERFGWSTPEFIHVGLLRNADKSKISKRKNPTNILWYQQRGYLPEALINFLCLLGHSHPDGREQFDLAEMVRIFELDRLNVAGPVFDLAKLDHLQGQYFRALDDDAMIQAIHAALDERLPQLLPLLRERMSFGGDICQQADIFFRHLVEPSREALTPKGWNAEQAAQALAGFLKEVRKAAKQGKLEWTVESLEARIRAHAQTKKYKPGQFFMLLRVAACGRAQSPPLFDTLAEIGQLIGLQRLEQALLTLQS